MLKTELSGLDSMQKNIELWDGWFFYDGVIYDDARNRYTQEDIRKSWQSAEIVNRWKGSKAGIHSLKQRLDERIAQYNAPTLCLIYENSDGITEKIYKLSDFTIR